MIIPALTIEQDGPGIDLTDQPEGYLLNMSDPVADFAYARNAVTLTYDLAGFSGVRLGFKAMEYGDEPHAPPAAPFGSDANFDGVAVSVDGVNWYEIQDLRQLRSDKFTAYDLDLDDIMSGLGLAYGHAVRIRFCQYDDNPAPMDGFTISGITLEGTGNPPVLHLPMNDNAPSPLVVDDAAGHHDQTFLDPTGDPNTDAHSVPGKVGTALSFDGVDDSILVPEAVVSGVFAAGTDFAVALWWRSDSNPFPDGYKSIVRLYTLAAGGLLFQQRGNDLATYKRIYMNLYVAGNAAPVLASVSGDEDNLGQWHHYVMQRRDTTVETWRDGVLTLSVTDPTVSGNMGGGLNLEINAPAGGPHGVMDDFRVYDRALYPSEIAALAGV